MNYCQDGLQVFFATETQQYIYQPIYGHYELQKIDVNGRPYFKSSKYIGIWWDGDGSWYIGEDTDDNDAGQSFGYGYYRYTDAFCPHQFSEGNWWLWNGNVFYQAGNDLGINCNCIFICTKKIYFEFHIKRVIISFHYRQFWNLY